MADRPAEVDERRRALAIATGWLRSKVEPWPAEIDPNPCPPGHAERRSRLASPKLTAVSEVVMLAAMTSPVAMIEEALLDQLRGAFDALAGSVRGLDADALDATHAPDTNSIAVLVVHTIETARSILHDIVGEPLPRDRDAAFQVSALSADDLLGQLAAWSTEMDDLVGRALAEPLDRQIRRYRVATSAWWLLQVLSHTREHAAHAALTRQLLADGTRPSGS